MTKIENSAIATFQQFTIRVLNCRVNNRRKTILKALILLTILILGGVAFQQTGHSQYMTKEKIASAIEALRIFANGFGSFGPILFIIIAALAITFFIPSVTIIFLGVTTFGGFLGTILSTISIYIATLLIYITAQRLGRDFVVANILGTKLKKLETRLHKKGLWGVLYLRLLFFMSPPLNWLMALSNISFRNYFLGTVFGTTHRIIIFAWLTDILVDIIHKGDSLNLFKTPILLIPMIISLFILFITQLIDRRLLTKSTEQHPA